MQRNTKTISIILAVVSFLLASMLAVLIYRFDPRQNGLVPTLFYLIFLAFAWSCSTLVGFLIRRFFGKREYLGIHAKISMRQGLWIGILATLLLLLKASDLFNLILVSLLLLALIFLESYFLFTEHG